MYPAIAIADAVRARRPDAIIQFAGSREKLEFTAVPKAGYPIHPITVQGLQRKLTKDNLVLPFKVAKGLHDSLSLVREFNPDVVVGTGGYVALPVLLAARYLVKPVLIQEQNAFMGLTNRVASKFAASIHLAFEEATPKRRRNRVRMSGNPVRKGLAQAEQADGKAFYNLEKARNILFVFGGSMGSQALNAAVSKQLKSLLDIEGLGIIWQTGSRYFERYSSSVASHPRLNLVKYIDRMDLAYAAADIALCRSGASTCSELMMTGTPSILVPSPNVTEDHQTKNARSMEKQGASILVPESEIEQGMAERVKALLASEATLSKMSACALKLARPEAADDIALDVLHLAGAMA